MMRSTVVSFPIGLVGLMGLIGLFLYGSDPVSAYPLDGYQETDISRLEGYRLAQDGLVRGKKLSSGALQGIDTIQLRLQDRQAFDLPKPDKKLSAQLQQVLSSSASKYGVAVLDLSDLENVRYGELNPEMNLSPGSVGKLMVALGLFQSLADLYPDDVEARRSLLKNTTIVADEYIIKDHHTVPFWQVGDKKVVKRKMRQGDRGSLYTFLDWMASNSSNASASMLIKQLVLLRHYGLQYPRSLEEMDQFLATTKKRELSKLLIAALQEPITRNDLDLERFRQGGFFTREGKRRIPGTSSRTTSRELMRFLVRMEKGQLVDSFSSLEIKRLLYLTDRRIRYASSPALKSSAVYFKSGSYYKCKSEPGFTCKNYQGNVINIMNSVAIIKTINREPELYYLVTVVSNILYKNQAYAHQALATKIHRLMEKAHPMLPKPAVAIKALKKPQQPVK